MMNRLDRLLCWGVLGTAGIARGQVVPAIQSSANGRVTAVAGRDLARTQAFAADFSIPHSFATYADLLASDDVDAVYIPLPNSLHAEWAMAAANAGKAVLCEKPLATTALEAEAVVEHFAKAGVPLMEGFMYRFHPQNVLVKRLLADGAIGDIREVRSHLSVDIMAEAANANVRFDKALGGGALLDMGCYSVNIARRLFGAEPVAVMATPDMDEATGVEVGMSALLDFAGGRTALASASFRSNGNGSYQIIGSKGTIDVPRAIIPGLGTRVAEGLVIVADSDGRRTETAFDPVDQYQLMVEAFADAVLDGTPVPYPPADAVANLRVLDAITASARSGRREDVVA